MIERRKGTIQRQRITHNLLNPEFKIDQRSFEDILAYIVAYVEHINFINTSNTVDGNWKAIIEQDPVIYSIGIIKAPVNNLHVINDTPQKRIATLLDWYDTIEVWYHKLLYFKIDVLADKIGNVLRDVLLDKKTALLKAQTSTETVAPKDEAGSSLDLDEVTHTFRKMILYIQNFTSHFLQQNVFSQNNHMPNNAMYITFAILFHKIQEQMNALGQRHLDFYYKDILQQTPAAGIPTQTVVCFELTPKSKGMRLPKHTALSAGKLFNSKQNIVFETQKPIEVVPMRIVSLETLYFNKSPFIKIGTNTPTISNIIKTTHIKKGKPVTVLNNTPLFGANEDTLVTATISEDTATDIGCIIASPVLFLEEGHREVTLTFHLDQRTSKAYLWQVLHDMAANLEDPFDVVFNNTFEKAFSISYSTATAWITLPKYTVSYNEAESLFNIRFSIEATAPSVDALTTATHTKFPMVKIVLDPYAPVYTYSFFKHLALEAITIDTHVKAVKNLALYNPVGKMPLTKSFHLFGAAPEVGNYLMVGKSELFKKELTALNITIDWDNLPEDYGGFNSYYEAYSPPITNDAFLIGITALSNGYWLPMHPSEVVKVPLFETLPATTPEGYNEVVLAPKSTIAITALDTYKLSRNYHLSDPIRYDVHTHSGFFKLELSAPKYGFGKSVYHKTYRAVAAYNAKNEDSKPLPNPPFIPKVKQVSLDYAATDTIYFNNAFDDSSSSVQGNYMHITPFGIETIVKDSSVYDNSMFSNFEGSGYLYLKLSKLKQTQTITLFFDLKNDTPDNNTQPDNISIEYKKMDRWVSLSSKHIISDGTAQLTTSGIIELVLPYFEDGPQDTGYELRFIAKAQAYTYPKILGVYLNAVTATCTSTNAEIIGQTLPAYSIHKPITKIVNLKKIIQPAPSYGGTPPTPNEWFYTKVSERLRHKDRALTLWDFEHLILQHFQEVIAVKCTNLNALFKPRAGHVKLIVLSQHWKHNDHHYFNTNTLQAIHSFISQKANAFIKIEVQNPKVEWLLVNCFVTFKQGSQGGYYHQALNSEISDYLCPLSHSDSTTIEGIGATVVPRMLRSHIENLTYIETIKQIEIEHIVKKSLDNFSVKVYKENEAISPSTPWSILAPKPKHNIYTANLLKDTTAKEVENENLQIGVDYIIASDFEPQPPTTTPTAKVSAAPPKHTTEPETTPKINTILNFKIE